uniref:Uncharacterized protein n=1 Tax=Paraburkholderia sprentiae WSM5005 TaxID=754502 RepID=A0A1I9YCW0_9BURK
MQYSSIIRRAMLLAGAYCVVAYGRRSGAAGQCERAAGGHAAGSRRANATKRRRSCVSLRSEVTRLQQQAEADLPASK